MITYDGSNTRIGDLEGESNYNWGGKIDEVTIWNIALDSIEIHQLMSCPPTGTESGLVGYWNFEEGPGSTVALDQTSNGNNGTINGATYDTNVPSQSCNLTNANGCDSTAVLNLTINQADTSYTNITACDSVVWNGTTYDSSGTYTGSSVSNNYSASLDGINDYVDVGNNSVLDIDNSVTIEAWINPSNLSNRHAIYSTRKNNNPGSFQLEIGTYIGVGTNYVAVTGLSTWVAITGSNVINTNSGWVHIAYTRDGVGNNHEIYINGIPQIINTNPYTFINNNASKEIGRGTSLLQNYEGQIDQVRIWDIALTQIEIQNYMDCSPQVNEVGLVGYWNFEEGSGTTAFDLTSNGNNGTLNGATYDTDAPSQLCPFTNASGCDSNMVFNLTFGYISYANFTVTRCDSFISPSGKVWNTTGTYLDTIVNVSIN